MTPRLPPAGWQVDPLGAHQYRYWDGARWTPHVADNGVQSTAVLAPPAPAQTALPGMPGSAPLAPAMPKSKTTAVLLAVFLGFWTWLHTYKVDAWKFWLNLGLSVITLGIWALVAWVWAIIDVCVRSEEWYAQFPNGDVLQAQARYALNPPPPGWTGEWPPRPRAPAGIADGSGM